VGSGPGALDETIGSDRLIALTRADEGRRYFSLDGLRSVVNLTDDSGSPVSSYHLDAWGNFRFPEELTHSANRFAFTGHIYDTETGLYNAKARYFDPKLGRFLTQDSFLGNVDEPPSLHRYLYANDNPTTFVDASGYAATRAEIEARAAEIERTQGRGAAVAFYTGALVTPVNQTAERAEGGGVGAPYGLGKAVVGGTLDLLAAAAGYAPAQERLYQFVRHPIDTIGAKYAAAEKEIAQQIAKGDHFGAGFTTGETVGPEAGVVLSFGSGLLNRLRGARATSNLSEAQKADVLKEPAAAAEPPAGEAAVPPAGPPAASAPKRAPHKATLAVLDPKGSPILTEELVSGGSGKPKPTWPEQGAVHTEGKGTTRVRELVESGVAVDEAAFSGQLRPCPMCKGSMNKLHRETGVPSTYVDDSGSVWRSTDAPPRQRAPRPAPTPVPAPTPAIPERPVE
jgi:RHS repeat-associated protein